MKKRFCILFAVGLMALPMGSYAAFYQQPHTRPPAKSGAHQGPKSGAHQAPKSGAHSQRKYPQKNGAHQGPRNGSKPAITAKPKLDPFGKPIN